MVCHVSFLNAPCYSCISFVRLTLNVKKVMQGYMCRNEFTAPSVQAGRISRQGISRPAFPLALMQTCIVLMTQNKI